MLARLIFAAVDFAARRGLADSPSDGSSITKRRQSARITGVRGETYAYWYLRRQGYILVARNFTFPGFKGEIDLVGYDGPVLAFVEVKTRTADKADRLTPEDAVTEQKQRFLARMARQFLRSRRIETADYRFDVLAIDIKTGTPPIVRLHKGAFAPKS
jgi:putative endonuclease